MARVIRRTQAHRPLPMETPRCGHKLRYATAMAAQLDGNLYGNNAYFCTYHHCWHLTSRRI